MTVRLLGAALVTSMAAMGCSSEPDGDRATGSAAQAGQDARGDQITVSGCLTSASDGRTVLTAAPDPGVTTPARAATGARDTHSYVLVGGDNLQAHIGRRVEVTGTLAKASDQVEHQSTTQSPATRAEQSDAARTSTKEEVDIQLRELNVSSTREVAPTCVLNP